MNPVKKLLLALESSSAAATFAKIINSSMSYQVKRSFKTTAFTLPFLNSSTFRSGRSKSSGWRRSLDFLNKNNTHREVL